MAKYLHPSVESTIVDNSITFLTSEGTTQLFAAFTSDKGEDNVIKMITSPSEFLFEYGEPNMRKHGQSLYNIMNWLQSGGGLYGLRVMPDNAGYSHTMFGLQTKIGSKQVKDSSGTLVSFDDVEVKTVVNTTEVNNVSDGTLVNELTKERDVTVDGFETNMLFGLYPKGRGTSYKLGFKMYLNDEFKETYDFNVYSLEITQISSSGSIESIEGPFNVSLDPDAQSISGESIFIKYMVDKYSNIANVIFNEDAYGKIGEIINPNVHPKKLDMITFDSMEQVYADSITGSEEDLLIAINEYDSNGNATGSNNLVDVDDSIEKFIVTADNNYRSHDLDAMNNTIDNAKLVLSNVKAGSFDTLTTELVNTTDGTLYVAHDDLVGVTESVMTTYESVKSTYDTDQSDASSVLASAKQLVTGSRNIVPLYEEIRDYSETIESIAETTNLNNEIDAIRNEIVDYDIVNIKLGKYKGLLEDADKNVDTEYAKYGDDITSTSLVTSIYDYLGTADELITFLKINDGDTNTYADDDITSAESTLATLQTEYNEVINSFAIESDKTVALEAITTGYAGLTDTLLDAIEKVRVENGIDIVDSLIIRIDDAFTYANAVATSAEGNVNGSDIPAIVDIVEGKIADYQLELVDIESNAHEYTLEDLPTGTFLVNGSDGDLDVSDSALRSQTVESLLVRAYTGLVDDNILNKKLIPVDLVLDANYTQSVKDAISELVKDIRRDFMGFLDTGFQATPKQSIDYRKANNVSDFRLAVYTQDLIVSDAEYTGKDIKVTPTYMLAGMIPTNDDSNGIQYPLAGNRRGIVSGFKKLSYNPNEPWKTQLYKNQLNYIESDNRRTRFGTQLTSQKATSALSNINNVRVLLKIQRDAELMMEDYQFEFNDPNTLTIAQSNLNGYLQKWVTNKACTSISGTVYASEYDRKQKVARVRIELEFNSTIERIFISLTVN